MRSLIYDAKSKTNEEDSAERFKAWAAEVGMVRRSPLPSLLRAPLACRLTSAQIVIYTQYTTKRGGLPPVPSCQGKSDTATIYAYIIATKSHSVGPEEPDQDLKLFLDIDMSVLGSEREGEWEK